MHLEQLSIVLIIHLPSPWGSLSICSPVLLRVSFLLVKEAGTVDWKKYVQPKSWVLCFIQWEFLGLQGWEIASPKKRWERWPRENCSEEARGAVKVIQKFCKKGQVVWTSEVFLWVRENQIPQVNEFSTFLCMGRCKSLGSLKSFLSCAPQLSGASVLRFHTWVPQCSPWGVAAVWSVPDNGYSFPSWVLLGLRNSHLEGWHWRWLWHACSLLMAGYTSFLRTTCKT